MRYPLATSITTEPGDTRDRAGLVNGINEGADTTVSKVFKRPGAIDLGAVDTGTVQSLHCWDGQLQAIVDGTLADLLIVPSSGEPTYEQVSVDSNTIPANMGYAMWTIAAPWGGYLMGNDYAVFYLDEAFQFVSEVTHPNSSFEGVQRPVTDGSYVYLQIYLLELEEDHVIRVGGNLSLTTAYEAVASIVLVGYVNGYFYWTRSQGFGRSTTFNGVITWGTTLTDYANFVNRTLVFNPAGTQFVATGYNVSSGDAVSYYSSDGLTFTGPSVFLSTPLGSYAVKTVYAGDRFVAVRGDATSYSADGNGWATLENFPAELKPWKTGLAYNPITGVLCVSNQMGASNDGEIGAFSVNGGETWHTILAPQIEDIADAGIYDVYATPAGGFLFSVMPAWAPDVTYIHVTNLSVEAGTVVYTAPVGDLSPVDPLESLQIGGTGAAQSTQQLLLKSDTQLWVYTKD